MLKTNVWISFKSDKDTKYPGYLVVIKDRLYFQHRVEGIPAVEVEAGDVIEVRENV